jgi:hypothetical protein
MSVIIQVFFYKRTGRRIFKMAPIHHHFEQIGWSEATVGHPLLDHQLRSGAGRPVDAEAAVIASRAF